LGLALRLVTISAERKSIRGGGEHAHADFALTADAKALLATARPGGSAAVHIGRALLPLSVGMNGGLPMKAGLFASLTLSAFLGAALIALSATSSSAFSLSSTSVKACSPTGIEKAYCHCWYDYYGHRHCHCYGY
jgi:hypothetical protein